MKTGGHIKPCKVGSVEEHNERRQEYVERMKHSKHPLNFYPTLAPRPNFNSYNREREEYRDKSTGKPMTVAQVFNQMIKVYTEKDKRHRRPPLKERERLDPNTGKMKKIAGWSPIREMVVVIKPDTKPEDFRKVTDWFRANGVETMFLSLHFDEGHLDENGKLKVNYHAHMGLDFFDWETGKTAKLGPKKMKELQTVLADALGMERGEVKELTGAEHLDVVEQRIEAKKNQLMPKLMKMIGGSDKEALEAAQAIIRDDQAKAQRNLLNSERKLRNADKRLQRVEEREKAIDHVVDDARRDERAKMQPAIDELKGKYDAQVKLNHMKNGELKTLKETVGRQQSDIDSLKSENSDMLNFIDMVKKILIDPLIRIFKEVLSTVGHEFTGDNAAFVKQLISADSQKQERKNADQLWDFVTNVLDIRTHKAWMDDTKDSLRELADKGWVKHSQEQSQGVKR